MNAAVSRLESDAERIAAAGDCEASIEAYLEAGRCAAHYQLWQSALRCYRGALELDLVHRPTLRKILALGSHLRSSDDWLDYARAVDRNDWPQFGCRGAHVLTNDSGSLVACPDIGAVLELLVNDAGVLEAFPDGRFHAMPIAMALVILRRALWPSRREGEVAKARVEYRGRRVWLRETGGWS
ncbi:MAG: hypothetical protein HOV81_40205 [Kofleriaceae bacterium]|nr:hypothetical protein [Kofleriaceae bacterium]